MDAIGIGMTHYPMLAGTDEHMADLLKWTLNDPGIPAGYKDPANWPPLMQKEWADDEGVAAAAGHRADLLEHLRRCRDYLDDFQPDVVVVWGDDQYENFREEVVPPFCVLAYPDLEVAPFEHMNEFGVPNAWGWPDDFTIPVRGDAARARQLTNDLVRAGFDVAYSYEKRANSRFPHAILNTQLFLDYDNAGSKFPYALVPMTVNCYGQHAIVRRGGMARFADIENEDVDPVGPSPQRCFELGRAMARSFRDRDLRVAFVASSSWSHAFLNDKSWHIVPDTPADEKLYEAFQAEDWAAFTAPTVEHIVGAGQHEMLNWFCLAGACAESGLELNWSDLVVTDLFNSNKCFALFS
ncbi:MULTISPECIES: hypothetical protein [unclassified Nocardioides]|uniref:DODA-type extradiol aromatic ring-opening family dioxygenase n=1 Tax=unclassified Nocardioides TaxID=2615069 RepID=UPI000056FA2A|nr:MULTISPECIES: hypothetical protein [unclassified Nocardioides]ABL81651.1 hypothetical protein Noca_2142 [Nocardioides sp. JS614]